MANTSPVQITVSDLTAKVNEGWKKDALAAHYGLPMTQMTQALKDAGLKIRKLHRPKYELVDDTAQQEEAQDVDVNDVQEVPPEIVTLVSTLGITEETTSESDLTTLDRMSENEQEAVMPAPVSAQITQEENNEGSW